MALSLERLSLESLAELDNGIAVKQFLRLLEQAQADIKSRPGEKRPRKIQIQLSLTPKTVIERDDELGTTETILTGCALGIFLDVKLPNRRTLEYDLGVGVDGALFFNPNSPFDHRQPTLFDNRNVVDAKSVETAE